MATQPPHPRASDVGNARLQRIHSQSDADSPRREVDIGPGARSVEHVEAAAMSKQYPIDRHSSTSTRHPEHRLRRKSYNYTLDPRAVYVAQLNAVLDELTQTYDTLTQQASSTKTNAVTRNEGNLPSPHLLPSGATEILKHSAARFIELAKEFTSLVNTPAVPLLLQQTQKSGTQEFENDSLSHSSTPTLDPRLDHFYDAAGNVKLQGEILVELDYWYADQASARMLLQDQGLELADSDEEFQEEYLSKRKVIETKLDEMISIADAAKAVCLEAGLDLKAGTRALDSSENADPQDLVEPEDGYVESRIVEDFYFNPLSRLGRLAPAPAIERTKSTVEDWMESLSTPCEDPSSGGVDIDDAPSRDEPSEAALQNDPPVGDELDNESSASNLCMPIVRHASTRSATQPHSQHEDCSHEDGVRVLETEGVQPVPPLLSEPASKTYEAQRLDDEDIQIQSLQFNALVDPGVTPRSPGLTSQAPEDPMHHHDRNLQVEALTDWKVILPTSTIPASHVSQNGAPLARRKLFSPEIIALSWSNAKAMIKDLWTSAKPSRDPG